MTITKQGFLIVSVDRQTVLLPAPDGDGSCAYHEPIASYYEAENPADYIFWTDEGISLEESWGFEKRGDVYVGVDGDTGEEDHWNFIPCSLTISMPEGVL